MSSILQEVGTMFQFQNGAIKICEKRSKNGVLFEFQFQNGAIKIRNRLNIGVYTQEFQFQNGAIKIHIFYLMNRLY